MPFSVRRLLKKGLNWVGSYLATWRELILRPFKFVALPQAERTKYNGPGEFVGKTVALGGAIGYVMAWVFHDPLTPPTAISIRGTTLFYCNLAAFIGLWWLFGVFILRAERRKSGTSLKEIFVTLVYLVAGTATAVELVALILLATPVLLTRHRPDVGAFLSEHIYFLIAALFSLFVIACIPFFFTAWIVTKAVRKLYSVGFWRGVLLPAICWMLVNITGVYFLNLITINKLSAKELEAVRKLHVLSDLEAAHFCQESEWLDDFTELKSFRPDQAECGSENPLIELDILKAQNYTRNKDGYRFAIQLYDDENGCLLRAHPLDYGRIPDSLSPHAAWGIPDFQQSR